MTLVDTSNSIVTTNFISVLLIISSLFINSKTHLLSKAARGNNIFMRLDCEVAVDDDIVKVNVIHLPKASKDYRYLGTFM